MRKFQASNVSFNFDSLDDTHQLAKNLKMWPKAIFMVGFILVGVHHLLAMNIQEMTNEQRHLDNNRELFFHVFSYSTV